MDRTMPMAKDQRDAMLVEIKGPMTSEFGDKLSEHDLFMAREYAAEIATQHHDQNSHESIVVHVDVVPYLDNSHLAVLEYGSAPRHTVTIKDDDGNTQRDLGEQSPEMGEAIVQVLKALRVPARLKSTKLVSCGGCGHYHPTDFNGECRDDGNRFPTPNDSDDEAEYYENGDPGDDVVEDDLSIETMHPSGGLLIATIHNGYRVQQRYFDYTREQAVALFREHLKELD